MTAALILRIESKLSYLPVRLTTATVFRTTPGRPKHLKRATFSLATTPVLRPTVGAFTEFGRRNLLPSQRHPTQKRRLKKRSRSRKEPSSKSALRTSAALAEFAGKVWPNVIRKKDCASP